MSSPLQHENVNRAFSILDVSGNGRITWGDFEKVINSIVAAMGLEVDSDPAVRLRTAYQNLWDYVRGSADKDTDDTVTRAEFEQAHSTQHLTTGELLDRWQAAAGCTFDVLDRDSDGYIDESALVTLYSAAGTDPQFARAAFQTMDTTSDGRVDKTEYLTHIRGIFTATDPSMKGARMLGGD